MPSVPESKRSGCILATGEFFALLSYTSFLCIVRAQRAFCVLTGASEIGLI